jgi:hypothetical protein
MPIVRAEPAPPVRPARARGLVVASAVALGAALLAWQSGDVGAREASVDPVRPAAVPRPARPVIAPAWPRDAPAAEAAAWQPARVAFPDGSTIELFPDRVRSPAGRAVKLTAVRLDAAGAPVSGILDMELVVETPGRPPFKLGLTEREPGVYHALVLGDVIGIGRTDVQLLATATGRPGDPGALGAAALALEIVGGVRFAGPLAARWDGDRLVIDVPVSTRTAAHAVVRGQLHAAGAPIAEVTAEVDLAEGPTVIHLDAGSALAPGDPRAAALTLVDATAGTRDGTTERWTDFWRGVRVVAEPRRP